jgi:hypothetical protein
VVQQPQPEGGVSATDVEAIRHALSNIPAGSHVEVQVERANGARTHQHNEGVGVGAGATAIGDKIQQGVDGSPPVVGLAGGNAAQGGGISATSSVTQMLPPSDAKGVTLVVFGALAIILGAVLYYLSLHSAAVICWATGFVLIAVAFFPGLALFAAIAVIAGLCIYAGYSEYQKLTHKEALRAVVAGVAAAPPSAADAVKAAISQQASAQDKATISAIKHADGVTDTPGNPLADAVARIEAMFAAKPAAPVAPPASPTPVIVFGGPAPAVVQPTPTNQTV